MRALLPVLAAACLPVLVGCGAIELPRAQAPTVPDATRKDPEDISKCAAAARQAEPLVTEWSAAEKADLEGRAREGGVAVEYYGCTMRIVPDCHVGGSYRWQRTTPSSDVLEITSEDELYAKLPLGAVSLAGELGRAGKLSVHTTVSGQLRLDGVVAASVPLEGACASATHIVGSLSVGAFELHAGGTLHAKADVSVTVAAAGGSTQSAETIVRRSGDAEKCAASTDERADPACGAPIQVFLVALPRAAERAAPPGTVRVTFVSSEPARSWKVLMNERSVCSTPCTRFQDPEVPVVMKLEEGFLGRDHVVSADLRPYGPGPLTVAAHPRSDGELVGGMTATVFGGLGLAAGISLMSVGCATGDGGLCRAGAITTPLTALLLAGGIWLMLDAGARAEVRRSIGATF